MGLRRRVGRRGGLGAGVAGVVVQVAGEDEPDPVALGVAQYAVDEPQEGVERAVCLGGVGLRPRALGLQPAGRRRAEDDLRVAEVQAGAAEVGELLGVDRRVELAVHRPQPPPRRQLHREVAAGLERAPAADVVALVARGHRDELLARPRVALHPGLAEVAAEGGQPVVPVVVAGQRHHRREVDHLVEDRRRAQHLVEPLFVLQRRGHRVHLVAAEHQQVGLGAAGGELGVGGERAVGRAGQDAGGGERRVEAVAGVGDVVDEDGVAGLLVGGGQPVELAGAGRHRLALVGVLGERRRLQHVHRGAHELRHRQPPDRGCLVHAGGAAPCTASSTRASGVGRPMVLTSSTHGPPAWRRTA